MERPTKITVFKKNDGYKIICMDEMSGSSIGMDMPINGYLALAEHFRTGAMEVSSDELSGLHKHIVINPVCPLCNGKGEYSFGGSFGGAVQTVRCPCGANGL